MELNLQGAPKRGNGDANGVYLPGEGEIPTPIFKGTTQDKPCKPWSGKTENNIEDKNCT